MTCQISSTFHRYLKSDWHLTDAQIAYAISMRILGQVIGAFCITIYADFYGRKPALIITLIILATGSILVAVSTNIFQISIFRLLTGIGIGAEVVIAACLYWRDITKVKAWKIHFTHILNRNYRICRFRASLLCIATTRQDNGNR